MTQPYYANVQLRKDDVTPSGRTETRRIYKVKGIEWIKWETLWYEIHVDPSIDVYYLVLGTGKKRRQ